MKFNTFIIIFIIFLFPILALSSNKSVIVKLKKNNKISQINLIPDISSLQIEFNPIFKEELKLINKNDKILSTEQKNLLNDLSNYFFLVVKEEKYDSLIFFLKNHSELFYFEPNYIYSIEIDSLFNPDDPLYSNQWALKNIDASKAWLKTSGKGVVVGVVDTGLDYEHEDLQDQSWINNKEDINNSGKLEPWSSDEIKKGISGDFNNFDDDGNGFIDDVIGFDFVDQSVVNIGDYSEPDPDPMDEMGHGTIVSGVIAAIRNNKKGIAGLAPQARIMALRVFDITGNAESDDIARAIVYAASNGAKVMNFSFGESISSLIVHDAIKFAKAMGCFMAASSGNDGYEKPHYPSDYEEVVSVGASTIENLRYLNSNYGSRLSITAPGENIMSTDLDNTYRTASGTSLASPHISAAAALILEINPTLKSEEILSILQQSASDHSGKGWTNELASGILNVGKAVNNIAAGNISISYPENNSFFAKENHNEISIIGSVIIPLFNSYQVSIGEGWLPDVWTPVSEIIYSQVLNDTLAMINTSVLKDTNYTVRIIVNQKNSKIIEKRFYLRISSNETILKIKSIKTFPTIKNGNREILVAIETNQECSMSIMFRPLNSTEQYKYKSNLEFETKYHTVVIGEEVTPDIDIEAIAIATRNDEKKDSSAFIFRRDSEYMTYSNFTEKVYSIPMSYLLNDALDFYNNGRKAIVVNNLPYGNWDGTKVYEFYNNSFIAMDSIVDPWIAAALGESNGDGIMEIFTRLGGRSRLYQANSKGTTPFGNILFKDELTNNFWAAGMEDINGDGLDELFAYSDTAFHCFSYKNGRYEQLAYAIVKPFTKFIGTSPGFAIADFDNDGFFELCHSNEQGNIFIFEYKNGSFSLEFIDTTNVSRSSQYICKGDFDADGIPEIAILNNGSGSFFSINEVGEPFWLLRIIKSTGVNNYGFLWNDYIYGVQSGKAYQNVFFRNGIAAGNVNKDKADELVLSTFPNLYIFKWNSNKERMDNLWWYPASFSNSAIIYDFDENGINEIGFSTPSGTLFYEYNKTITKPATPSGFDGYALNENNAILNWRKQSDAIKYEIYKLVNPTQGERIAITDSNSIILQNLEPYKLYDFFIIAINPNLQDTASEPTYLVQVYTHPQVEVSIIEVLDIRRLLVHFSGKLSHSTVENTCFEILIHNSDDTKLYPKSSIIASDSTILLTFNEDILNGNHSINIYTFKDFYNTPIKESKLNFEMQYNPPQQELYLKELEVINNTQFVLRYSDLVDKNSAENILNYTLVPRGKIANVSINLMKEDEVHIFLSQDEPLGALGKNYTITVKNVIAKDGINITKGAGNTLSFVFFNNDLEKVFVYPNPIHISNKPQIYFANLTTNAEVIIYSQYGNELRRLIETDNNGGVEWDGKDNFGNELDTGTYLFKARFKNENGDYIESSLKKFAIIR